MGYKGFGLENGRLGLGKFREVVMGSMWHHVSSSARELDES